MRTQLLLTAVALLGLAAAALVPSTLRARRVSGARDTVTLTAVSPGVWTEERVNAAAAWRRDFAPARPVLRVGETTRLRLRSSDVVHSFAVPELGIDPVEVVPGKTVTLSVTPEREGVFTYYCTVVCGERHFAMRGLLEVRGPRAAPLVAPTAPAPGGEYWRTPLAGEAAPIEERGEALFRHAGCVTCHGPGGRGGVRNPNSMNAEVPELSTLARRTFLFTPAEVGAFQRLIEEQRSLEGLESAPGVPLFAAVRDQYLATRALVTDGRHSTKLDPDGPQPPLDMPAWGARLGRGEIDAIFAYLLSSETLADNDVADSKGEPR